MPASKKASRKTVSPGAKMPASPSASAALVVPAPPPAPTKKSPVRARGKVDAVALLTKDHRDVKKLFRQFEKLCKADAQPSEKQAVAQQICSMLTVHAQIEEEIFYPAARAGLKAKDEDLVNEAAVEHASAKDLMAQIQGMSPDAPLYDAKVTVLGEYVDHHVQEEEEEMFPKAQRAKLDMAALGQQLVERKQALMADLA